MIIPNFLNTARTTSNVNNNFFLNRIEKPYEKNLKLEPHTKIAHYALRKHGDEVCVTCQTCKMPKNTVWTCTICEEQFTGCGCYNHQCS
jgi:hypothetical protein